jgi:hypothetical protein
MHSPELALSCCTVSGLRGFLSVFVDTEWEMSKRQQDSTRLEVLPLDLGQHLSRKLGTKRTFKVRIFDDRNFRVEISFQCRTLKGSVPNLVEIARVA